MSNMNKSAWKKTILSVMALIMLSACGGQKGAEEPVTPEVQAPVEAPVEKPDEKPEAFTAPLTGMPLEEASNRRPLAVMINNAPAARPQSGLSKADIVYEVLAEGGITRLIGIFQSQTDIEKIGPVRSIRPYLINIGESYGGVLVHAGGSPEAYSIIQRQGKQDMDEIGNAGAYFWRDKDRKAPHNLYTSDENLRKGADKLKYSAEVTIPQYPFIKNEKDAEGQAANTPAGEPAAKVDLTFLLKNYVVGYTYDSESKLYQRSMNGKPHIDRNDESVLTAANVIVLGAAHKTLDDIGRLAIDVNSGGEAMLFQEGQVIRGQWVRAEGDVIRFVKDGKEVPLVPGTTYFNIVPNTPSFEAHVTITNP
ncbi:DUF3048 domain-containing protein [Paenibacillus dakarensis]|uniref:DUF3048 domain-containing protein n=1 Tax=Paenibacillus dakarensis TaxID=1527293 RepID=UPI000AF2ADD7|nr:DUF3048 domain-containing protein [Paenibacillus dakarensis]